MDKNHKQVGKKPAQYKEYPAQYKEYGGSGKGVEDSQTKYNPVADIEAGDAEGSSKVKGPAGFNNYTDKDHQHPHPEGGGKKMGYAQTWGAARKSGAARGAAAVAKVLGAADPNPKDPNHTHSGVEIGSGAKNELEGVTLKPPKNTAYKTYQAKDYSKPLPNTTIKITGPDGPVDSAPIKNYETSTFQKGFQSVNQLKQGGFAGVPVSSGMSSGNPTNQRNRLNMLTDFTNFMKQPTSSPRAVTKKLNELKSGPQGGLMSDIEYYGPKKKKHNKNKKH